MLAVIAVIAAPISTLVAVWITHFWETNRARDQHGHEDKQLETELDAKERERVATVRQAFRHEQVSALREWLKRFYAGLDVSMLSALINAAPNPLLQQHIVEILSMPVADPRDKSIEVALSPVSDDRVVGRCARTERVGRQTKDRGAAGRRVDGAKTRFRGVHQTQTSSGD